MKPELVWEATLPFEGNGGLGDGRHSKLRVVMQLTDDGQAELVVLERLVLNAMRIESWLEVTSWGHDDRSQSFNLWRSVWEANAASPVRISADDYKVLGVMRSAWSERTPIADEQTKVRAAGLLHRLQMAAYRMRKSDPPDPFDAVVVAARRVAEHWSMKDGVNGAEIDALVDAVRALDGVSSVAAGTETHPLDKRSS